MLLSTDYLYDNTRSANNTIYYTWLNFYWKMGKNFLHTELNLPHSKPVTQTFCSPANRQANLL